MAICGTPLHPHHKLTHRREREASPAHRVTEPPTPAAAAPRLQLSPPDLQHPPTTPRPLTPAPGLALETNCPPGGPAEDGCCGSCPPPQTAPVPQMIMPTITGVELCQDGEDGCLPTDSGMDLMGSQDMTMEDIPLDKRIENRLPIQIFPDPVEVVLGPEGTLTCVDHEKERLPSIVVEPTDVSEVESGELRWPPEDMDFEDDEDLFLEQCIPPANIADWGDEEEETTALVVNHHQHTSLLDLQTDEFRDETPTLPPESAPALN
ncbi:LOW QUALITY PROTEIN: uncharacterized protein lbhl [Alosa alosa]|uniref:LOW QUALITY PROTEIN: uncharacterized protein lbhl n=1 Tax=Alosa alosa TaxID=278164 RepID=UPI0020152538|nr:LOW QUALITY PROTEIN: uncharacterized protein lbhl [Alosa alosa]